MRFKNKIAVVTGGSNGIGLATAKRFASEGAIVYVLDRVPLSVADSSFRFIHTDVSDLLGVGKAIATINQEVGCIDYAIANAGVYLAKNIEDTSSVELDGLINTNIKGAFYLMQHVLPIMKQKNNGCLVLIGSDQSIVGKAACAAYGMTKAALAQLAKSAAIDYAPFNIRINCVAAGTTHTAMLQQAVSQYASLNKLDEDIVLAEWRSKELLRRFAEPAEIAAFIAFVCSEEAGYVTGGVLSVDGGYTAQ